MSATTARGRYRPRVAPRRGGGRFDGSRIQWDRVGRITLVLVLFVIVLLYIRPVSNLISTWTDSGRSDAEVAKLESELSALKDRRKDLKTDAAAIREARALGLVGEGEQAYVIKGLE